MYEWRGWCREGSSIRGGSTGDITLILCYCTSPDPGPDPDPDPDHSPGNGSNPGRNPGRSPNPDPGPNPNGEVAQAQQARPWYRQRCRPATDHFLKVPSSTSRKWPHGHGRTAAGLVHGYTVLFLFKYTRCMLARILPHQEVGMNCHPTSIRQVIMSS